MDPVPDALVLPRVAEYLAALPEGIASHPGCCAKAGLLRRALASRPLERRFVDALPEPAARVVTCPPLDGEWVPDVWLASVLLGIADAHEMTEEGYLAWIRELNAAMLGGVYRVLLRLAPVELMLRGLSARWSLFHRGSALELLEIVPGRATVRLAFPTRLFHGLALRQFAPVLETALRLTAPDGRLALVSADDDHALFEARWGG